MLARGFLRNEFDYVGIDFEELKVDCRNAILAAKKIGDFLVSEKTKRYQDRTKPSSALLLLLQRLGELVLRDNLFAN